MTGPNEQNLKVKNLKFLVLEKLRIEQFDRQSKLAQKFQNFKGQNLKVKNLRFFGIRNIEGCYPPQQLA